MWRAQGRQGEAGQRSNSHFLSGPCVPLLRKEGWIKWQRARKKQKQHDETNASNSEMSRLERKEERISKERELATQPLEGLLLLAVSSKGRPARKLTGLYKNKKAQETSLLSSITA